MLLAISTAMAGHEAEMPRSSRLMAPPLECPPVQIDVGSAGRNADGKVFIPVTVDSGRFSVGGTQNDILFDNTVLALPSVARCRITPAIDGQNQECEEDPNEVTAPCKNLIASVEICGGDPQPDGCPINAGPNISRFRGLVTAFAVLVFNPIPNGLLYECEFDVLDPNALPTALRNSEVSASEPMGKLIVDVVGSDGAVTADPPPTPDEDTPTPTVAPPSSTPTQSRTPTLTPTGSIPPTPVGIQIIVRSAGADAEGQAVIPVSLFAGGANVGGMQNDILFDNTIVELASVSSCRINPEIDSTQDECMDDPEQTTLPCKTLNRQIRRCGGTPQAAGCPPGAGENISRFRALIAPIAVRTTNPVPDGLLYTCTFQVLDRERLPSALINTNTVVSNPFGTRLSPVIGLSGAVTDEPAPPVSPTRTATSTVPPTPTATETATSTSTTTPSPTPTSTPTVTVSQPPCTGDCDGSDSVTVDEITLLISVALGTRELDDCTVGDRDGDQKITVDELVSALTNGLNGCSGP
jgi:hypothetical protein